MAIPSPWASLCGGRKPSSHSTNAHLSEHATAPALRISRKSRRFGRPPISLPARFRMDGYCPCCVSLVVILGILEGDAAHAPLSIPRLIVKQPARVEFKGKPFLIGFDARGDGVIAASWGS